MKNKTCIIGVSKFFFYTIFGFFLIFTIALKRLAVWFSQTFTIGIQEILFTIKSPLQGADTDFLNKAIAFINLKSLIAILFAYICLVSILEFLFSKVKVSINLKSNKHNLFKINVYVATILIIALSIIFSLFNSIKFADKTAKITEYLKLEKAQTKIFEEQYIKPSSDIVKGNGKNLIYIYMESMETTYASKSVGGSQEETNYIPYLTELASKNINFSQNENLGGFHTSTGAGWTMGALFTTSTGVPFKFPVNGNEMNLRTIFATGITAIGDILAEKGYTQEFLCGSDGNFAGRKQFFEQHGNYKVFDLFTAREKGYIAPDYSVWWGFEDEYLYKIAKDEILALAKKDEPFNFTMLTVDTHHVGGYKCNLCEDKYSENLANVISCADKQVYEFVQWCKKQDFYENTVIVIVGDHPRMDSILVDGISYYDRTVFNCFINSVKTPKQPYKSREFSTVDIFPTVLSAMGFEIEGNRLGLGTNLFSDIKTHSEEMGFEKFNEQMSKYSRYYIDNFS